MGCDIMKARTGGKGSGLIEKRILLLGLDNAGKTSVLLQLKENSFMPHSVPTIGLNIEQVTFRDYNLTFWDVGGQATKLWKHYFDSVDGLIFVIDATDQGRIAKAKAELLRVSKDPGLSQVPYLLMFNKIDLDEQRMSLEELILKMDVEELSKNRIINFQECSALTQEGIWEGITQLTEIFDRSDPTRTGASGPSTGATDSTSNKEGSVLESATNNAPVESKSSPATDGAQPAIEIALQHYNSGIKKPLPLNVEENKNLDVQQREVIIKKDDQTRRVSMRKSIRSKPA